MLKRIRSKLSPKEIALFKLATWTCLIVWMVLFFVNALILSNMAGIMSITWYPGVAGQAMRWVLPIWIVFTSLLIIVLIARWTRRKLG